PIPLFAHRPPERRAPPSFPTRRSSDLGSTLRAFGCSPSTRGRGCHLLRSFPEAGEGSFGGGDAAEPSTVGGREEVRRASLAGKEDRKSTRLNSSHEWISYAVFCLKKKK